MMKHVLIRKGEFRDSVVLMNVSRRLQETEGIKNAIVLMGTSSNKKILDEMGLLTEEASLATPNDLIIAIKGEQEQVLKKVLQGIEKFFVSETLDKQETNFSSLSEAIAVTPNGNLVQISVPGGFAAREARMALQAGLSVLVFSDNVSLEDEVALKRYASDKNLLCMGPDCGVCNINGSALALASVLPKGNVGIIGASGSGVQEVSILLSRAGIGISQCIGTGGRDLRDEVGAITLLQGLSLLNVDSETELIVLVGKKPSASIIEKICTAIQKCSKPLVACFLGTDQEPWEEAGAYFASTMDSAAQLCKKLVNKEELEICDFEISHSELETIVSACRQKLRKDQRYLRGIYGGGTFVSQAQVILGEMGFTVFSNSPFAGGMKLEDNQQSQGHTVIDLGDEEFTRGRPHPVIDPLPYKLRIMKEANDPETAVLVIDAILGPALYHDPASIIIEALEDAYRESSQLPVVIASVCGSVLDPQKAHFQEAKLKKAGVIVMPSSAQAIRLAALIVSTQPPSLGFKRTVEKTLSNAILNIDSILPSRLFAERLSVINVGVNILEKSLLSQGVTTVQVNWKPPAKENLDLISQLDMLFAQKNGLQSRIDNANQKTYQVIASGQPVWRDVCTAGKVIPAFHKNLILHTGPSVEFERMTPQHRDGIIGGILFEGLASDRNAAIDLILKGDVELAPGLDYGCPSAGMATTTYSMPVIVMEDVANNSSGFCPIYEGPSYEGLRWGVYNNKVADNWRWLKNVLSPILSEALKRMGGVQLNPIIARSLQMGDENHSRQHASTLLILAEMAAQIVMLDVSSKDISDCFNFIRATERFAQSVYIAGAEAVLRAAQNIPYSTVVTGMGGNGIEMGIKISSLGDRWFTAPAPLIHGSYINPGWTIDDTLPFSGDSCTIEVFGLGGLAAAASPSVTIIAGGTNEDALNRTREMWAISVGKHPMYVIPNLNNQGTPVAVDMLKVLATGITPKSHAGIIHKAGGQAGAGIASVPMECFHKAFSAFYSQVME